MTTPQHDDGGPAFPCVINEEGGGYNPEANGMTLRDYFAAKAMQGMFCHDSSFVKTWQEQTAKDAYTMADAMLAEREKQNDDA